MAKEIIVGNERDIFNPCSLTFSEREQQLKEQQLKELDLLKKEKQSPFGRWTQYNNEHTKEMMWLALKYPKAHAILLFLVDQMDNYNAVVCSYKVLQEVLEVGQATIARNIKILKDYGYIAVLKSGSSNVYAINDNVYWKSWGNKKQYSKFPANVVLSMSEQEENYQISFAEVQSAKYKEIKLRNKEQ